MANLLDLLKKREDLLGHVRAHEADLGVGTAPGSPTCRSWATCGERATSGPSSWSANQASRATFDAEECDWLLRGVLSPKLFEAGLICRADDRAEPMIVVAPPLIAGPEEISFIEATLRSVLDEAWRAYRRRR